MRKILICYFSGTGNTKKVVDLYNKSFTERGNSVTLFNVENEIDFKLDEFDLVGIAYPIHAFNAPSIMVKFAKNLHNLAKLQGKCEKNAKKQLFIIKTSGEPLALNNVSSYKIMSKLKKYFVLTNEYHYCMPYNIIFRHTDNMAYKMWNAVCGVVPIECDEILEGKKEKFRYFPFGHFLAWVFRIEHWGGRFNGKRYKVNDKCVKCGLCAKRCPTNNITIEDGRFVFGNNCLMCMRCSFYCPKNAIKIGWFEKWKVNGAYNFNNFNESEEEKHKKYCKKAYVKYFAKKQAKIANKESQLNKQ